MSVPFVNQLRTRERAVSVSPLESERVHLRVEMPEVWDVIKVNASPASTVAEVKEAALRELYPGFSSVDDYLMKLNGFVVFDESVRVVDAGARDGSIFLLTHRRRRPVR